MKTAKMVICIVSLVLFGIIIFQSCAAGISNALDADGETSGTAGIITAVCMLMAALVGIVTRKSISGGFVAGGFYAAGGIAGIANYGTYSDLKIWSVMCFIFAAVFIVGSVMTKRGGKNTQSAPDNQNKE